MSFDRLRYPNDTWEERQNRVFRDRLGIHIPNDIHNPDNATDPEEIEYGEYFFNYGNRETIERLKWEADWDRAHPTESAIMGRTDLVPDVSDDGALRKIRQARFQHDIRQFDKKGPHTPAEIAQKAKEYGMTPEELKERMKRFRMPVNWRFVMENPDLTLESPFH
jgi:hypothetical protein